MYENMEEDIWRRLRALRPAQIRETRKELKLSQESFATLIGRQTPGAHGRHPSVFSISRWETGKAEPGTAWGPTIVRLVEESEQRRVVRLRKQLAELEAVGAS